MNTRSISLAEARALVLRAQGFGARWSARRPVELLDHLGYIQLDSVNVVQRTHWIVPFSRLGAYQIERLHGQIYRQRRGFEYWGHEQSWLPMSEYRYFEFRRRYRRDRERRWWAHQRNDNRPLYEHVLARIRAEGALGSAAFEDPREKRGKWWDLKPAKIVLEDLFDQGYLMCADRTAGFARLYDLPERVVPPDVDTSDPGDAASARHLMKRAIAAMGVATGREAALHYRLHAQHDGPLDWRTALRELVEAGEVVEVVVQGWRDKGYAMPSALERPLRAPRHRPTLLSPFDNLVWERDRTERLFGFRYRIEIYTPEPKRTFGYYVLPLLVRGQIAGKADLKFDRAANVLRVKRLALDRCEVEEAQEALAEFAAHLGAERFEVERLDR
ncbi:MAG TPA: crosslink repair DNA glycosylase YcaQ family protein [Chloroflexota bacterium]|nr:crosslink repair DNA glycosylase YcaQ family protein [Chloroflexota bacterium]